MSAFPEPVSDPAAYGLPETADDDSYADVEASARRAADGPQPAPVPPDADDEPLALDETPGGATQDESLDARLAQEEPDAIAGDSRPGPTDDLTQGEPVEPNLDSPVSMYDRPVTGVPSTRPVGRLVEPDEGAHPDEEAEAIARDAGVAGGGPSAEEEAVHEIPPEPSQ
jgi:hypothetical protein